MIFEWQEKPWKDWTRLRERLPHAILIQSGEGLGEFEFAQACAQSLLCEGPQPDQRACGACGACNWFSLGNHPDFRLIVPESMAPESREEGAERVPEKPRGASASHDFSACRDAARALARDSAKPLPEAYFAVSTVGAGPALAEGARPQAARGDTGWRRRCAACCAESRRHGCRSPALHRESWKSRLRSDCSRRNGSSRSAVGPGWMAAALELRSLARPGHRSGAVQPEPSRSDRRYGTSLRRGGYRHLPAPAGAS